MENLQCKVAYHTTVENMNNPFMSPYIFSFSPLRPTENLPTARTLSGLFEENGLKMSNCFSGIQKAFQQVDLEKPRSKLALIGTAFEEKTSPGSLLPLETGNQPEEKKTIIEDFPLGKFMRFLKHLGIKKLLSKIKDLRDPKKTKYKIEIILQWVLSVFFFRCESTNALQTAFEKIPAHRREALWNFFGLDSKQTRLPHRTVVTDCLSLIDQDEINRLLEQLFKWALKSKLFYNHKEKLVPYFTYHLACDGVYVHKYSHPHSVNEQGKNACPYCLPRVRNKGTENEITYWFHVFVNLAFILPGGIQLPIYVYALKAKQLQGLESANDKDHKQECEMQAAHQILPLIKKQFPRLPITLLTDSLYANEPLLKLCRELGWDFLIVRQEGSLKTIARHCDELGKIDLYRTSYTAQKIIKLKNGGKIEQTIKWFNAVNVKNEVVHVLRFEEIEYDSTGKIALNAKGNKKRFKTEWLSSIRICKANCFKLPLRARMRADHEDLHNVLKNKGFAAKHDYARSNPNACLIWKLLMFVAFWIFEMFSCTKLAQESKGSVSWMALAEDLLSDLQKIHWRELRLSPSLQKECMQFRYVFP